MRSAAIGFIVVLLGLFGGIVAGPRIAQSADVPGREGRQVVDMAVASSGILQILVTQATPPRWNALCGGTFVALEKFLTAYHCIISRDNLRILDSNGIAHDIAKVIGDEGRDLALIFLTRPASKARIATLSIDVSRGDTVWLVGVPYAQPWMVTRGMISLVTPNGSFENCSKGDKLGMTEQQLFITDIRATFGNSGGGYFDGLAQLVGVHVRSSYAFSDEPAECSQNYWGQMQLWGYAVGPLAIQQFLGDTSKP